MAIPTSKDVTVIQTFSPEKFSDWLVDGFEKYLNAKKDETSDSSGLPFYPVSEFIEDLESLAQNLGCIYDVLLPPVKIKFRKGVAMAIGKIHASSPYEPKVMKQLLLLANEAQAIEAVNIIPTNYSFLAGEERKELHLQALELLAAMSSWTVFGGEKPIVQAKLSELIETDFFREELYPYSDIAFIGLCNCSPDDFGSHLAYLRPFLSRAISEQTAPLEAAADLARRLVLAVNPKRISGALHKVYQEEDLWVLAGLLRQGMIARNNGKLFVSGTDAEKSHELILGFNPAMAKDVAQLVIGNASLFKERYKTESGKNQ
jgi:hypothetical protein